jgi:outer membrane cobalamin receptor
MRKLLLILIGLFSMTVSAQTKEKVVSQATKDTLTEKVTELNEVVVRGGVADIAKDRKTPVAVSTIKAAEIQQKLGNQEFPEVLANTPSVYTSKAGGGFGDSRITIRGFDQKNIAVMINGVPVNDMENSSVYWSNWAGLSDVTSSLQVQRGLGSSKLVNSSVGGTINVQTRTSDMKEGGVVSTTSGNNNWFKTTASYNTGVSKKGFSTSLLLSQTSGNEYMNGSQFAGANYFLAFGYKPNEKHDFQFTFTGAPQWHNQRSTVPTLAQYLAFGTNGEPNRQLNLDAGTFRGQDFNFRTNYYHKPIASFNWDYKISDRTKLATVVYGSWGRGGGSNGNGAARGYQYTNDFFRKTDGTIDVDKIYSWNTGALQINGAPRSLTNGQYVNYSSTSNDLFNGISKISSINSHDWYGGVASLNSKLTNEFTVDFGVDMRTYRGIHYQVVNDLLGSNGYKDLTTTTNGDINNPNQIYTTTFNASPSLNPFFDAAHQDRVNYANDSKVNWIGSFGQVEYSKGDLTAFVQGAVSQQSFKRIDYFRYSGAEQTTSAKNILGGNIKVGLNYNINKHHNVFANSGIYSKQPFMNAVYPNNRNFVNDNLTNEKILGTELGYGYRSSLFNANLNLYRTTWGDRFLTTTDTDTANPGGYYSYSGVNETHQGAELDFTLKAVNKLTFNGMLSYGDWHYDGNANSTRFTLDNQVYGDGTKVLYLDKVKVGNAAQVTAALGAVYEVNKGLKVDANYRHIDKLFTSFDPTSLTVENNKGSLQLPSYGLVDAGFSYKLPVGKEKSESLNFRFNMNNVFDTVYIAEGSTNIFTSDYVSGTSGPTYADAGKTYNGVATANKVFFGFGRTWNLGVSYKF